MFLLLCLAGLTIFQGAIEQWEKEKERETETERDWDRDKDRDREREREREMNGILEDFLIFEVWKSPVVILIVVRQI